MPAQILVIDDDPAIANVLRRGLAYEGFAPLTANSGTEGLSLLQTREPDLVILDVLMPGMDGLEVLRRLRVADPDLPVLLLTARDAAADQVQGLQAGADDYVTKPFDFAVLVARVQALLRRRTADHPTVLRFADLTLDTGGFTVQRGARTIALTTLEFRLLDALLRHPRQVLAKEVLLERVWGYDFGGNGNIVEVYIMQLRQKLEADGEARLIHTVRNAGYVLREE